jgi:hypothetical protein
VGPSRRWQTPKTHTRSSRRSPQELNLIIEPDKLAGVWANFAQVSHTEHEFTVDFGRLDPIQRGRGIVVARVGLSPLFVTQLIDALTANWQTYAKKALPKEVYGDDQPPEQEQGDGEAEGEGA